MLISFCFAFYLFIYCFFQDFGHIAHLTPSYSISSHFPQELFTTCNPVVTKPKPKVDLPKEENPSEPNGPVNTQENPEAQPSGAEQAAADSAEAAEAKPDMDLD